MQYDEFVGQVQHRARLADGGQAMSAIHATLETLGKRLVNGQAEDLAAQLPREIGYYLRQPVLRGSFGIEDFIDRVSAYEGVSCAEAERHARAVLAVLCDAVSPGEIEDVRAQLPREFDRLFPNSYEATVLVQRAYRTD
jgi:uncharacterized protein (DUF2267 family)